MAGNYGPWGGASQELVWQDPASTPPRYPPPPPGTHPPPDSEYGTTLTLIPTHGAFICPSLLHTHTHTHTRPVSESRSGESHRSQMLTAFPEQQMNESLLLTNGCRKGGRMKVISPLNADFRLIFHT